MTTLQQRLGEGHDNTEEGGFKQPDLGRPNGFAALDDFIEHKHIALKRGLNAR